MDNLSFSVCQSFQLLEKTHVSMFPSLRKKADFVSIHKKDKENIFINYRHYQFHYDQYTVKYLKEL